MPEQDTHRDAPYTPEEKHWLEVNWGGEFKFLMVHGLKIHNEEDREEGRQIVRTILADDKEEEKQ
ncbi:hypothetical protein QBC38DRAFT_199658 [Podospora fimiseda]|uniref:Uncharacterized protein n=1 Tax=Podospora fimiseda TaxID=252190 RepID=A0AAN7BPL3_9PEZI|nr:hypothetical protein QBC38DRAFT_199658 [Podospora fimiseda]